MKKTFLIITALLFITSTAFPQSKVNVNSLKEYGGKAFKVDDDEPYTGRVFDLNKRTGKKTLQGQYKKGLKTGKWSYWDENGRKYKEKDYSNDIDTDIWTYIDKDGSRYKGKSGGVATKADIALNTIQCGMCKNTIESGVAEVDGVVKVEVDTEKKVGHVIYKAGVVNLAVIEGAIAALGYDANETKADPDAYAELPGCCQKGGMH